MQLESAQSQPTDFVRHALENTEITKIMTELRRCNPSSGNLHPVFQEKQQYETLCDLRFEVSPLDLGKNRKVYQTYDLGGYRWVCKLSELTGHTPCEMKIHNGQVVVEVDKTLVPKFVHESPFISVVLFQYHTLNDRLEYALEEFFAGDPYAVCDLYQPVSREQAHELEEKVTTIWAARERRFIYAKIKPTRQSQSY